MFKNRLTLLICLLLVLPVLAAGCGPAKPAALTDDEVNVLAENILTALDNNDYAAFSRDFSDEMKKALPEEQFKGLADMLHAHSGKFVSAGSSSLSNKQGFAIYQIPCEYEHEEVLVTIVFRINGKNVEGLFFDSPFLRATPTP
jgi:hypothetical protein